MVTIDTTTGDPIIGPQDAAYIQETGNSGSGVVPGMPPPQLHPQDSFNQEVPMNQQ
jgi:hypothetical protein